MASGGDPHVRMVDHPAQGMAGPDDESLFLREVVGDFV
jgi:hypothetical protein